MALIALAGLALAPVGLHAASTDDPSCKPVLEATNKMDHTDNHQRITIVRQGEKTIESESIQAGDMSYFKMEGAWRTGMSTKDMAEQRMENIRDAKVFTCQYERDEAIAGEPAAVYQTHQDSDEVKADAEIWVSKSRGLILKEVVTHPEDHQTITILVDYNHVEKPAVTAK